MLKTRLILTVFLVNLYAETSGADTIDFMCQRLAKQIGDDLWDIGEVITKRKKVQESFSQVKAENKSGSKLVDEIARDLKAMLDVRITAVKEIANRSENLPKTPDNLKELEESGFFKNFTFINTRKRDQFRTEILREREIESERLEKASQDANYTKKRKPVDESHYCIKSDQPDDDGDGEDGPDLGCIAKFNETLNIKSKEASVFFPLDVFDKNETMARIMYRTKGLDEVFRSNYEKDPQIGWQYFCNSTGLFRHFPATEWSFHPINTFDCRMRNWYTGAAASTKDMIILVERAGSMKGQRILIAIDVIRNLLDTLTQNDFVNIIQFGNGTADYLIDCAEGLVQATSPNIHEFKLALNNIDPWGQSDLGLALDKAFPTLQQHRNVSANCNQMIMLITDGMEYNQTIQDKFRKYNWERGNNTRIFTYMIGSQIPENDFEQIKLMACENRGYYVQVDITSETRENALKYIPVISRPLVFSNHHPVFWSNLYVDILDPIRTTNNDWDCRQREMQRVRVVKYLSEHDWYPCITSNDPEKPDPEFRKYVFMTTVSMAAYDHGANASLMGVAAIDVPLYEFERLFQNYRLGVGGYAFIIDQNGNILSHPDFRPLFQGKILKPSYDSVDLVEVELMDDEYDAREFNKHLLGLREAMMIKPDGKKFMQALQPFDDMRRALRQRRNYFWRKIAYTPFTVVVTFPENLSGRVYVDDKESDSMMVKGNNLVKLFEAEFRLHPDWIYCRGIRKGFEDMKLGHIDPDNCEMTPEEELIFYLEQFEESGWRWRPDHKLDSNDTRCDRKLMWALLHDAKITKDFNEDLPKPLRDQIERFEGPMHKKSVKTSFISTHSGLLRFKIFDKRTSKIKFGNKMKNSIDEVWYKHAVDFNLNFPDSFVYSVPFNAYELSDPIITATNTIFIRDKVPIAVVGFQLSHSKFESIMEKSCPRDKPEICYVLDDNGYILSDPEAFHAGKFFGSVEGNLMKLLVEEKIYEPVTVFDYQGVCYEDKNIAYDALLKRINNSALNVFLWDPFKYLAALFVTLSSAVYALPSHMANLLYPDREHYYDELQNSEYYCPTIKEKAFAECLADADVTANDPNDPAYKKCFERKKKRWQNCTEQKGHEYILMRHLNRSRPHKCDKSNVVYSLTKNESNFKKTYEECDRPFAVQRIEHSNLILLITNLNCPKEPTKWDFNDVPRTKEYFNTTYFCRRLSKPLFRNRSKSCMTNHAREPKYDHSNKDRSQCGRGQKLSIHRFIYAILFIPTLLKMIAARDASL